jgi:iron complex outermembrane recepter protein
MNGSRFAGALLISAAIVRTASAQNIPTAGKAPVAAQSRGQVSEIVVTAQRRSERLVDVPIAITAKTGQQLLAAGVDNGLSLGLVIPGLNFAVQGAFAEPTIRGIGTTITGSGDDANVALYIDGVYQPNQTANIFEFNNVSNVEVLKGPQGALFGRNATGGAIEVTTFDPSFHPSGDVALSYGRFNQIKGTAYITGPISDSLAGNLAARVDRDDGYGLNVFTGDRVDKTNTWAIRSKLRFSPNDTFNLIVSANYNDVSDNAPLSVRPLNGSTNLAVAMATASPPLVLPTDSYDIDMNVDPVLRVKSYGGSATAKWTADAGTLTSITSYEQVHPTETIDFDNTPINAGVAHLQYGDNTFTQELNYASPSSSHFNWIGGIYYYNDDGPSFANSYSGNTLVVTAKSDVRTEAEAAFAEGTLIIRDKLSLIVGGRLSNEKKTLNSDQTSSVVPSLNILITPRSNRWAAFTPRAVVKYDISPSSHLYFSYNQGFKSGLQTILDQTVYVVAPERVDAYEIGFKHLTDILALNASAFYYDYKNIQIQIQENDPATHIPTAVVQNAARSSIYGGDLDLTAVISENWKVSAGVAYTHGVYDDYRNAIITTPSFTNIPGLFPTSVVSDGNSQTASPAPLNGIPLIRTPLWTFNVTPTFTHPFAGGHIEATATVSYNSGFYWTNAVAAIPSSSWKQSAYTLLNAQVSWISPDDRFRFTLWGANLANTRYAIFENPTATGTGEALGPPLETGFRVEYHFG